MCKVPEVTLYFWIIKVLCTTVGETASDFLNVNLNFGLTGTSVVIGILLLIVLFFQFRSPQYTPGIYWITVVLISIFGTLVTDNLTDSMGVPLEASTMFFSVVLALTFAIWYAKERTLSIHSIYTKRREIFYWLAILFTFALGTATGDLMAESLGLGYATTGIIICIVVTFIAIAWRLGLNPILAFWLIYIMTRPLGASLGDYLSQPYKYGGIGLGATITSIIFTSAILMAVIFLSITKHDQINKESNKDELDIKHPGAAWQVAIVMVLLLIFSGSGYYWRHSVLQAEAKSAEMLASQLNNSSDSSFASPVTNNNISSHVAKIFSPLGDLSNFRTIIQDTLNLVNSGDLSAAKSRVADLEYEWDNAEAHLKPKSPVEWTKIDDRIDSVLRELRAVHQNAATCKSALMTLLAMI